ncbi:hypothetical protein V3F56_03325 [Moorellaceae bacterium AZ2]
MSLSSLLTVTFLVLSVLAGVGAWLYTRYVEAGGAPASSLKRPSGGRKKAEAVSLADLWEVEDIREGVLVLTRNRYRLVARVSAADFWLLSDEEQNAVEDYAIGALMQVHFPVQVLVTSQAVDVRGVVEELRSVSVPGALRELARQRADFLEAMSQERAANARQAYLVIGFDTPHGFDFARGELYARLAILADALAPARLKVEVLGSDAVADLLYHLLNRNRPWRPSEGVQAGVMTLYHISQRSVAQ